MGQAVGKEMAEEIVTHIRDEYSTWDWIMDGILTRAGFIIDDKKTDQGFGTTYLCSKRNP